jgi:hypothetical protein
MTTQFDGPNKHITLSLGVTTLSVQSLWSDWVRWHALSDNGKYLPAFRLLGGDPIDAAAGTSVPFYAYLLSGWRIRPQEANHTLNVTGGVLLVDGGGDPFVNTLGGFTVRINYSQPVQAINVWATSTTGLTPANIADAVWSLMQGNGATAETNLHAARTAAENAFAISA